MAGDSTKRTSEEVDERQLELASAEGDSYIESPEEVIEVTFGDVDIETGQD